MDTPALVLHQFPRSHYNEKARWGLDWKAVPHVRRSHLPGPHALRIRRLSGQTATPVLVIGGEVVAGSARILDALERRFPDRPLYPADPELRRRALEIQERFDREVGPATRTSLLAVLADPPHPDMALPRPVPERVEALLARFAGHPALHWVREQYRRHRAGGAAP